VREVPREAFGFLENIEHYSYSRLRIRNRFKYEYGKDLRILSLPYNEVIVKVNTSLESSLTCTPVRDYDLLSFVESRKKSLTNYRMTI
jgi:hypothetical protein